MGNVNRKYWEEEYYNLASRSWSSDCYTLLEICQNEIGDLLDNSTSISVSDFSVSTELIFGIDLDITINADGNKSEIWVAESVNYVPNIFYFFEAIISTDFNEYFYSCEEEGPYTFLYAKRVEKDNIRFIHLSQRVPFAESIQTEDLKIRQDIIINKNQFIKIFYSSIMNAVKNVSIKSLKREYFYQIGEFKELRKGSSIIEKYLSYYGL